jgi:hypothetical protein
VKPIALARAGDDLYLVPLEALPLDGVTVLGVAVLTPEQEKVAREIAESMLREAVRAIEAP